MCKVMALTHVAGYYGLGWDTVKQIDARHRFALPFGGPPLKAKTGAVRRGDTTTPCLLARK
jgi:hypothetical protein